MALHQKVSEAEKFASDQVAITNVLSTELARAQAALPHLTAEDAAGLDFLKAAALYQTYDILSFQTTSFFSLFSFLFFFSFFFFGSLLRPSRACHLMACEYTKREAHA